MKLMGKTPKPGKITAIAAGKNGGMLAKTVTRNVGIKKQGTNNVVTDRGSFGIKG